MLRMGFAVMLLCPVLAAAQESSSYSAARLRTMAEPREKVIRDVSHVSEHVRFRLVVGPDGKIRDLEPLPHQNSALVNEVLQRVATWQFATAVRDGKPVEAETTLYVRVDGERQQDGEYSMQIADAGVGPRARLRVVPNYPERALRAGRTGSVLVEARVDAEGRVVSAEAVREVSDRTFIPAALQAVKKWQFEPERIDGVAQAATVTIPISFAIAGMPEPVPAWKDSHPELDSEPSSRTSPVTLLSDPGGV